MTSTYLTKMLITTDHVILPFSWLYTLLSKFADASPNEIEWNLDLSFFKGMEKTNDECGKTINPGNYFF
jgi:hypothetical protein